MAYEHKAGRFTLFMRKQMQSTVFSKWHGEGKALSGESIKIYGWWVDSKSDQLFGDSNRLMIIVTDENAEAPRPSQKEGRFFLSKASENHASPWVGQGTDHKGNEHTVKAWLSKGKYGEYFGGEFEPIKTVQAHEEKRSPEAVPF